MACARYTMVPMVVYGDTISSKDDLGDLLKVNQTLIINDIDRIFNSLSLIEPKIKGYIPTPEEEPNQHTVMLARHKA